MPRAFKQFINVPKNNGVIMVIEKEFGVLGAKDWVNIAKGICNIVKITFGTGALYDQSELKKKIKVYKDAGISPMIGGTLTEVAIIEAGGFSWKHIQPYLKYAKSLGFTHIEFSDGTIYIPDEKRSDIIRVCLDSGFNVISEVGKKDPKKDETITLAKRISLMEQDIRAGADMVIIESRESGKGIGVMDKDGSIDFKELDAILNTVGCDKTMIEAPEKNQQQSIYMKYGPGANIGNVQPKDIIAAAALRAGLRGDTISVLRHERWAKYHKRIGAPVEYDV